jgi:hypothetical protein
MKESTAQKLARVAASRAGARVFRNNVGSFWTGSRFIQHANGSVTIFDARRVQTGLSVGSSDLIGWQTILITPEMVGKPVAAFVSLEIKSATGRLSKEQRHWLKTVAEAGGIAGAVRTPDEVTTLLQTPPTP